MFTKYVPRAILNKMSANLNYKYPDEDNTIRSSKYVDCSDKYWRNKIECIGNNPIFSDDYMKHSDTIERHIEELRANSASLLSAVLRRGVEPKWAHPSIMQTMLSCLGLGLQCL